MKDGSPNSAGAQAAGVLTEQVADVQVLRRQDRAGRRFIIAYGLLSLISGVIGAGVNVIAIANNSHGSATRLVSAEMQTTSQQQEDNEAAKLNLLQEKELVATGIIFAVGGAWLLLKRNDLK